MKFKDFLVLVPVGLALTACGSSSTSSDPTGASGSSIAGAQTVINAPGSGSTGSSGSSGTTGSSGSSGVTATTDANGCPLYPQHALYSYPSLTGTGSGRATYLGAQSTPSEIIADSKLRVSIKPGGANGTVGTGGTANYTYLSADVHLLANGVEISKASIPGGTGAVTAPNGSQYQIGIPVGKTSLPSLADFSNNIIGQPQGTTYSIYVDNIKTDYKCNQLATFAYYQTMGDCEYYYNPGSYQTSVCSGNWNWDYHQWNWACCYTNMLEQAQMLQCGVGTPLTNSTYSLSVEVETDSTPCITGP